MKLVNKTGYLKGAKTAKNPVNIIPSNLITTQGMAFPIKANGKTLYPNTGQYKFNTPYVVETPLKQDGSSAVKSFLSAINPKNWGVTDYSKYKTRGEAYNAARKAGEKEFMWNSNRFNTNMKGTPAQQLKWSGITNDRLGIKTNRSERAYNSVKPSVYLSEKDVNQQLKNYFNSKNRFDNTEINKLRKEYIEEGNKPNYNLEKIKELEEKMFAYEPAFHGEDDPYSEDAWKIYLGMPQTKNTFSISKYKPTKSKETDINYYSLPESFKKELFELYKNKQIKEGPNNEFSFKNVFGEVSSRARVLGNFTVNKGKDDKGEYISYYDKYDLNPNLPVIGKKFGLDNFVGKPFEIYDRIYLKDFENIKQDGADELKASEAAKFSYRIKDKKRRDTQVADMYNNTLDSFRGDTTGAKRHFKSFFTHYGSERFNDVKPLEGYYGFDKKDYDDKTLDSLGRNWHKQMKVSKKQKGTKSTKAKDETDYNDGRKFNLPEKTRKRIYNSVNPDGYPWQEIIPALGRYALKDTVRNFESGDVTQADKDAWAFYIGVPQKEKTVTRSKYTPTQAKTKTNYYTIRNAYPAFEDSVISNATRAFNTEKNFWNKVSDKFYGNKDTPTKRTGVKSSFKPLQNVTYSKGKDEKGDYYSIYDTYDFGIYKENKIGKPYEIYDRVYYNTKTGKPLNKKKQGSKDMKPLIKYKDGSKSVSLAFSRGEKDPKGGLTQKGVDKYNRATGGNLKMAVTTPPSKLKPGSKAANRRKSFCARMSGVKGPMAKNGKPTRKALALRKWNC